MKKALIIIGIIISILVINKEEKIIIPEDAIRFRVIANSDNSEDQLLKKEIVESLKDEIVIPDDVKNIEEARKYINKELPKYETIIKNKIDNSGNNNSFHINYGKNYFPQKEYNNVVYNEGEYESLVVTLGEGKGKNFWCVLFPPLCMINTTSNVEYKSLIKEIINKYF